MQLGDSSRGKTSPLLGDRENVGKLPRRWKYTDRVGRLKEFVENRCEFREQVLSTIAGIPSGPLDLEVLSWRRVFRTLRVEKLTGGIVMVDEGQRGGWDSSSSRL